jgi:spore maturation protein SpmA
MSLFLAINCGSVTLIPFTIIGYRFASGSKDPSGIIVGTLLASMASVVAGVTVARWLSRSPMYRVPTSQLPKDASADAKSASEGEAPR